MKNKTRVFKCNHCKEVFKADVEKVHDNKVCPFCGGPGVDIFDMAGRNNLKVVIKEVLESYKKTKINNLHRYLDYALDAGISKRVEINSFLQVVNDLDAALLWIECADELQ
jgi:hypothetical protein